MKRLQWFLNLAEDKPALFSVALLLIAITVLANVVVDRDKRIDRCQQEIRLMRVEYNRKLDSLVYLYDKRESDLVTAIIESYRTQIEEQKRVNNEIRATLTRNEQIIQKARKEVN